MFQGTNQANPDLLDMSDLPHPMLEKLIQSILVDRYLKLTSIHGIFPVYLRHLYHENGQWFIDAFDFSGSVHRTFPVAQLEDVEIYEEKNTTRLRQIMTASAHENTAFNVVLKLGPKAISQYKKYHSFNVKMAYTHPFQLSGICKLNIDISNKEEVETTANWLRFLGSDLKAVRLPQEIEDQLMKNSFL
jgi:predicted DNA-binding transcriptional regulator YafY